jgi:hypothetical protein
MIILAIVVAFFVALSVASLLGLTPDTRDPEYGVGRLLDPRIPHNAGRIAPAINEPDVRPR